MMGMYSCKQVSQIVSESLDRKLPVWTWLQLRMHLAMCGICSRFRKNMIRIDHEVKRHAREDETDIDQDSTRLSEATRNRIQRQLADSK
jgi:hypothetical protein